MSCRAACEVAGVEDRDGNRYCPAGLLMALHEELCLVCGGCSSCCDCPDEELEREGGLGP